MSLNKNITSILCKEMVHCLDDTYSMFGIISLFFISLKNVAIKGLYQGQPKYGVPVFKPREESVGK